MTHALIPLICVALFALTSSFASAQQTPPVSEDEPKAIIKIDKSAVTKAYSRMIFGGFLEHFDNQIYGGVFDPASPLADEKGFRKDVIAAMKELKVAVIRWPGGCFVDAYHWRKGVGKNREPYGDPRWGVIELNTFGTHEFVELCRRIGAEPYICFNGLADVQENLDWVAYCNATKGKFAELRKANGHPEPFNVRFWSVGNERNDKAYIDRVRETARKMKAFDPDLRIMCSGSHGGRRAFVNDYLFVAAAGYLDLISIHNYWLDRGNTLIRYDYLTAIMRSELPGLYIAGTIDALRKAGRLDRLKISFDEWNLRAWQHPGFPRNAVKDFDDPAIRKLVERRRRQNDVASQYTMADALFSASFLNACLRHCDKVSMANIAPLVNTRGPLYVHPKGIVKRTHFHALSMYANLLESRVAKLQLEAGRLTRGKDSIPVVDAIATCDKSGRKWAVALINRHPDKPAACTVKIGDKLPDGPCDATVLAGDSSEAFNDVEHPQRVVPEGKKVTFAQGVVNLPPHSLTIVHVATK